MTNTTRRLFTDNIGGRDPSTFVGNKGDVVFNEDTMTFTFHDGQTPGGHTIGGGSSTPAVSAPAFVSLSEDPDPQQLTLAAGWDFVPATDVQQDLGHPSLRWRDLYLSGNTIHMNGFTISAANSSSLVYNGEPIASVSSATSIATNISQAEVQAAVPAIQAAVTESVAQTVTESVTASVAVDLENITTKSVTFEDVNVEIANTQQVITQTDWEPQTFAFGEKVVLGRAPAGGPLINWLVDGIDDADWGNLYNAEWARGPALVDTWGSDVTSLTYETEMDDFSVDLDVVEFEAHVTSGQYVLYHADSERYWKFDFHTWEYSDDNAIATEYTTNGITNLKPPAFSYTRTEYSDPTTGTLDPATAVTFTVTGWDDAHNVDVLIPGENGLAIHRGMKNGLGNPLADNGEDLNNTSLGYPALTEWAVVNDFVEAIDPTLVFYNELEDAYGGSLGNKIVGSKAVMKNTVDGKLFGFEFTSWTQGGNGGGWSATVTELDSTVKAGITFKDGSVLATKPGNVSTKNEWTQNYWLGDATAPLVFFENYDIGNNAVAHSTDTIMGYNQWGLLKQNSFDRDVVWLRADNIFSVGKVATYDLAVQEFYSSYSGQYSHAYSYGRYDLGRRSHTMRIKLASWASDSTIKLYNNYTGSAGFQGHYTTNVVIENDHATRIANVVGDGITINVKPGVTNSPCAPGEIWNYTINVYTDSSRVAHFTMIDCYQIA